MKRKLALEAHRKEQAQFALEKEREAKKQLEIKIREEEQRIKQEDVPEKE